MERSTHILARKSQTWFVEALLTMIQKKPYDEITISELCKKAQLDRRTFYRNFKDKDDVLQYYFDDLKLEYLQTIQKIKEKTFSSLADAYFSFWSSHLQFFKTAQKDQALISLLFQTINDFVPSVYVDGDGNLSKEMRYSIAFVVGGFHNVLLQWLMNEDDSNPEDMASIISYMFKDTISYWPQNDTSSFKETL